MKILLVNKFHYLKGGSERYYFTLADAFRKHGDDVIFFSMKDEKNVPCDQEKYFVENADMRGGVKSRLNMVRHMVYSKEAYKKMSALLKAEKPDLVILNLVHKQITCSIIDAIKDYDKNLPIVWAMHDLITICPAYTMLDGNGHICEKCLHGDFKNCIKNRCIKGSLLMSLLSAHEAQAIRKHGWYDKVDLYVCPSDFYRKKLEEAHFTKSPIAWIPNPLNSMVNEKPSGRDKGYFLYFGRLVPEKGVRLLLDAVKGTGIELEIVGTGPDEEKLKSYAAENKMTNVLFEGYRSGKELESFVENCKAVVLPSQWYENGPYSAMEAMALGKPLIVSQYGGLPELVENGKNGFIFHDLEELKHYLQVVKSMPKEQYDAICQNSLKRARTSFDPMKYIDRLLESLSLKKGEKK